MSTALVNSRHGVDIMLCTAQTGMGPHQTTGAGSPIFWGSLDLGPALNHMAVSHPCAKPVLCLALKFGVGLAPDLCGLCSSLL